MDPVKFNPWLLQPPPFYKYPVNLCQTSLNFNSFQWVILPAAMPGHFWKLLCTDVIIQEKQLKYDRDNKSSKAQGTECCLGYKS